MARDAAVVACAEQAIETAEQALTLVQQLAEQLTAKLKHDDQIVAELVPLLEHLVDGTPTQQTRDEVRRFIADTPRLQLHIASSRGIVARMNASAERLRRTLAGIATDAAAAVERRR